MKTIPAAYMCAVSGVRKPVRNRLTASHFAIPSSKSQCRQDSGIISRGDVSNGALQSGFLGGAN